MGPVMVSSKEVAEFATTFDAVVKEELNETTEDELKWVPTPVMMTPFVTEQPEITFGVIPESLTPGAAVVVVVVVVVLVVVVVVVVDVVVVLVVVPEPAPCAYTLCSAIESDNTKGAAVAATVPTALSSDRRDACPCFMGSGSEHATSPACCNSAMASSAISSVTGAFRISCIAVAT